MVTAYDRLAVLRNICARGSEHRAARRDRPKASSVRWTVALISLFLAAADHAAPQPGNDPLSREVEFLPVDEAFMLSARRTDGQLVVRWDMPDGYYLYRHAFSVDGDGLGEPFIPAGEPKVDEYFGDSEVYYGRVELTVPVRASVAPPARFDVTYQGCADYGLCYPPQRRSITLALDGSLQITRSPARAAKADVR